MDTLNKKLISVLLVLAAILLCLSACAVDNTQASTEPSEISSDLPEDPKFSQIQVGMTAEQILKLLGEPDSGGGSYFQFMMYHGNGVNYFYHILPKENNQMVLTSIEIVQKQPWTTPR